MTAAVADALSAECRSGARRLPDPLPMSPALVSHARTLIPRDADALALLALAVCAEGPVGVLCALAECPPVHILDAPLARVVRFGAGRFRVADPVLRAYLVGSAAEPERLAAHRRLALLLEEAGDGDAAQWHRARGAVLREPSLAGPLLARAAAALRLGDAAAAIACADEAAEHLTPGSARHDLALLHAGCAALAGGWTAESVQRLTPLVFGRPRRAAAVAAYLLGRTLDSGTVPQPESFALAGVPADCGSAARLGALLTAERGDRAGVAAWLDALHRSGEDDRSHATAAWCAVLLDRDGRQDPARTASPARSRLPESTGVVGARTVSRALSAGLGGDLDAGLRALTSQAAEGRDPRGCALSPLQRAQRDVAAVLLLVWAGRIGTARDLLCAAAGRGPVALPFAGLGIALARRLDLAVLGRLDALSRDLGAGAVGLDAEGFIDRAVHAYLRGRTEEAAVHRGLWLDQGAMTEAFALPGVDEVGPLDAPAAAGPPDMSLAQELRRRIRSVRERSWRADLHQTAAQSQTIGSPFERGRVEALLGSAYVIRADHVAGMRHLHAAHSLFTESGALAWAGMVDRRLRSLDRPRHSEGPVVAASPANDPADGLPVCRATWKPILTARELDVALLMAQGRRNREIASVLHVSVRTVEVHSGRIFAKLDVRTRHELTVLAHRTDQHR